ncbi:hypothetical protein F2P79_005133 [Pimephales promelas]|nr:hypothetical protein F2P79_005133 [Pimephales promelas]
MLALSGLQKSRSEKKSLDLYIKDPSRGNAMQISPAMISRPSRSLLFFLRNATFRELAQSFSLNTKSGTQNI